MRISTSMSAVSKKTMTMASEVRQPMVWLTLARIGMKTSWPVALLAVIRPTTRPRRFSNQRAATVPPSTSAVMPVPSPITTPHSATICHSSVMKMEPMRPAEIMMRAAATTRRSPNWFMKAAANGPMRPKRTRRNAVAKEIFALVQPNSR
ncbi:Uncharacterised protein [Brucella neotomae]|nr:Uncharacterised protein [Brucella neotomae]